MAWSNDPYADFVKHDSQQQKELEKRPKCQHCDEHIQDDYYYEINDEPICSNCLDNNYRKWVDDYIS